MTAESKKIVMDANRFDSQHPCPDVGQEFLNGGMGSHITARQPRPCQVRRWECLAVYLAVRHQGQGVEPHKRRWNHVIGQFRVQEIRKVLISGRTQGRDTIGPPATIAGSVLPRQDDGLPYGRVVLGRFDLSQLDAVPGASPDYQGAREIRCCRPAGGGPGHQSCTGALLVRH